MVVIRLDTREVDAKLGNLADLARDLRPIFSIIGDDLKGYFGGVVFEKQGVRGAKWKSLSAVTQLKREKREGYYKNTPIATGQILVWTGRLKNSFDKQVEKSRLIISNSADYFKYHQLGTRKIPKRPMLVIDQNVIDTVQKRFLEAFNKALK